MWLLPDTAAMLGLMCSMILPTGRRQLGHLGGSGGAGLPHSGPFKAGFLLLQGKPVAPLHFQAAARTVKPEMQRTSYP